MARREFPNAQAMSDIGLGVARFYYASRTLSDDVRAGGALDAAIGRMIRQHGLTGAQAAYVVRFVVPRGA